MSNPLVSVVTMNHNYGRYIGECAASVQAQTFEDFEHIIVNAGCSDDSDIVVGNLRGKLRAFQIGDHGLCGSRNWGMAQARGKYLVNLDADDRIHPQFLERLVAHAGPGTIVCPGLQEIGDGYNSGWPTWGTTHQDFCAHNRIFCCSMFCKEDFDAVGGYDLELNWSGYEDWELWCAFTKRGARVVVVPELLFYYRIHKASSTFQRRHLEDERVNYIRTKYRS